MVIPTKWIETKEFRSLLAQTPDTEDSVDRYVLGAISFIPPRPNEEYRPKANELVNILLLNTVEPLLYRDPSNGVVFVILPWALDDQFDYSYFKDIHPNHKAWAYYLSGYGFRIDDPEHDLGSGNWIWYDDTPLPKFELDKELTH